MLDALRCVRRLAPGGGVVTGVPCSGLAPLIAGWDASSEWQHIPAVNEAEAIGIAAGASVRHHSFVYLQNSGLGYALDGLTSLVIPADLAMTLIVSHRGLAEHDALPQHVVSGGLTIPIVEALGVPYATCYKSSHSDFQRAVDTLPSDRLSILIVAADLHWHRRRYSAARADTPSRCDRLLTPESPPTLRRFGQTEVLAKLLEHVNHEVVVTSTGHLSRQVCALGDRVRNFYLTGSMGLTASFALGVDVAYGETPGVVVIDGDGSALMHLGSLATVAAFGGRRYKHVVIDNNAYASTGGQPSSAHGVSFPQLAIAAGYRAAANAADFKSIDHAVDWLFEVVGPALLEVDVFMATNDTQRVSVHPSDRARSLRRSLETMIRRRRL